MYNLLISLFCSTIVTFSVMKFAGQSPLIAGLAGLVVFTLAYILIMRTVMKRFGALMEVAQRDVQANRADRAIHVMKSAFKFAPWQLYIKQQVNAQIGSILYLKRDFQEALPYLEQAFVRHWVAMCMLGISYMKKNKQQKMIEAFEKATSGTKKEPLGWAIYAYCLEKSDEHGKAIAVIEKGLKKNPGDEALSENLELLKEGKKMKMRAFGDMWYQFHLEKPGAIIKQQTKAMTGRRKMVRR
ncbi:tetratricopeptide repeat protein [Geopsychrobacter electrodiphilus]|uniref:tetratricopeptide repeat protein n=1 Tax=Geopsychrobacter electrodiphilus TaxID=225196 RepID=UPI00036CB610|nr:tetratricopeptide repeat protein [Geopsychrobacter electrodiphilus]